MSETMPRASWVPMIPIVLGQAIMSYNLASLPVALRGMVETFGVPPGTVATGIVAYAMTVAGFVMLGAKLLQRFGALRLFRIAVPAFGVAQVLMTFSPSAPAMIVAQALCGASAAVIVPSLVALIAENYRGRQKSTALGLLGSAAAGAGVLAFLVGGMLGTWIGWRPAFGILIVASAGVWLLSFKLQRSAPRPEVRIDAFGVVLAAAAIMSISLGFNNLSDWGWLIVVGIVLVQAFLAWTRRREAHGRTPLLALEVIDSPQERAAVYAMFAVVSLESALNFSVPLYIQIVQGRSPLATAVAMLPFNLTVFFSAMLVVRLFGRFTPRQIGRTGFVLCASALLWLAFVVRNDWSELPVLLGLVIFGIGQGALVTLVFNVLVTASSKELASDVGSLRGTTQNLASAVGTAVAAALLAGLLSAIVMRSVASHPMLTQELQSQVDLDKITFVSNDRLAEVIAATDATPEQKAAALQLNTQARLRALKLGLLIMAGLALLAIYPAGRLPDYKPDAAGPGER